MTTIDRHGQWGSARCRTFDFFGPVRICHDQSSSTDDPPCQTFLAQFRHRDSNEEESMCIKPRRSTAAEMYVTGPQNRSNWVMSTMHAFVEVLPTPTQSHSRPPPFDSFHNSKSRQRFRLDYLSSGNDNHGRYVLSDPEQILLSCVCWISHADRLIAEKDNRHKPSPSIRLNPIADL